MVERNAKSRETFRISNIEHVYRMKNKVTREKDESFMRKRRWLAQSGPREDVGPGDHMVWRTMERKKGHLLGWRKKDSDGVYFVSRR